MRLLVGEESYPTHMSRPLPSGGPPAEDAPAFVDIPLHSGRAGSGFVLPSVVLAGKGLTWVDPADAARSGFDGVDLLTGPGADPQKAAIIRTLAQVPLDVTGVDGWGTDSRFDPAAMIVNVGLGLRTDGVGAPAAVNDVLRQALDWSQPNTLMTASGNGPDVRWASSSPGPAAAAWGSMRRRSNL